jgi:hypothetical protein
MAEKFYRDSAWRARLEEMAFGSSHMSLDNFEGKSRALSHSISSIYLHFSIGV